jgi:catalase-peroxidase
MAASPLTISVGPEPAAAPSRQAGFGWANPGHDGKANTAFTSGIEGAWTTHPTQWDMGYFDYAVQL